MPYSSDVDTLWSDTYYQETGVTKFSAYNREENSTDPKMVEFDMRTIKETNWHKEIIKQSSELRRAMRANSIFEKDDLLYNRVCYRFPRIDPYNYVDGAREYIFITKVDLPILNNEGTDLSDEAKQIDYLYDLWTSGYKDSVFQNLCYSAYLLGDKKKSSYPFMRILSNRKTSNLDIPDINVEELETSINMYGSKLYYPKTSALSDENVDFSLEFEDTRHTEIYHLFKAYDVYRQAKWLGILGPGMHLNTEDAKNFENEISNEDDITNRYNKINNLENGYYEYYLGFIGNKILYDHMSIYKFLVANDGCTILYGAKITGCYPKSISRSSFSEIQDKGPLKITIGFKASGWIEDSNLYELMIDFNCVMFAYGDNGKFLDEDVAIPLYDFDIGAVSQDNVDYPFIRRSKEADLDGFYKYYLLWGNSQNADPSCYG